MRKLPKPLWISSSQNILAPYLSLSLAFILHHVDVMYHCITRNWVLFEDSAAWRKEKSLWSWITAATWTSWFLPESQFPHLHFGDKYWDCICSAWHTLGTVNKGDYSLPSVWCNFWQVVGSQWAFVERVSERPTWTLALELLTLKASSFHIVMLFLLCDLLPLWLTSCGCWPLLDFLPFVTYTQAPYKAHSAQCPTLLTLV